MVVVSCLMLLLSLTITIFFQGNLFLKLLMVVSAAGLFVVSSNLIPAIRIKLSGKLRIAVYAGLSVVYVICGLFAGGKSDEMSPANYQKQVQLIREEIGQGEYKDAAENIKELQKKYGETEELAFLNVETLLYKEDDPSEALAALNEIGDKECEDYFLLSGMCYQKAAALEDREDHYKTALACFTDGAKKYPDNFLLNYKAGCLKSGLEDYFAAEYYLMQAYFAGGDEDRYTPYVLAGVYDKMGESELAYAMLEIADERGLGEEKAFADKEKEDSLWQWYQENKARLKEAAE